MIWFTNEELKRQISKLEFLVEDLQMSLMHSRDETQHCRDIIDSMRVEIEEARALKEKNFELRTKIKQLTEPQDEVTVSWK